MGNKKEAQMGEMSWSSIPSTHKVFCNSTKTLDIHFTVMVWQHVILQHDP